MNYARAKKEKAEELKKEGKWVCIFTGLPMPDYIDGSQARCHHLKGRAGKLLTDKKYLSFYMDEKYHTGDEGIHSVPISILKQKWWWKGFISRIKDIDLKLAEKYE